MQIKTILVTGFGFVFLGLGAVGVLLPLWPTTPFVLLSVACFSSTPRIKAKIMKFSFFREHIENYEHKKGLSRKTFLLSMLWLWGMLLVSMIAINTLWVIVLLSFIGVAVTLHLVCIAKSRKQEDDL